jgi:DtxR family Mn-dependent transcriptional regulator
MNIATRKTLSASLEDYLEAIYQISEAKQAAKAKDISVWLDVNKSSVTGALKALSKKGLVNYAPYDLITLTPAGKAAAERVVHRHRIFFDFLVRVLGIEPDEAEKNACRAEHALSGTVLERIAKFTEFVEQTDDLAESFRRYYRVRCTTSHPREHASNKESSSE